MELDWGNAHHISAVREAASGLKLLLGADVCYSLQAVTKLFTTAMALLADGGVFLLCYVSRWSNLDSALVLEAEAAGFWIKELPGTRRQVSGGLEGWIYELWKP